MANWSNPTNSSLYSDVLTNLKDRDVDAGTLFLSAPTNPVTGMIRFNRTTDLFEEYNGSTWVAQPISVAGGGTGAATAADARSNLGLGTLSTQNSNAINVTGGSISGLTSLGVSGNFTASGTITGTVPNASTTATSANTASAIVARDASGNFSAGTITATINGTVTNGVVTTGSYSDPAWITALAATKLSGTLADARLSSNVPLKNAANSFSAIQSCIAQPVRKILYGDGVPGIVHGINADQTIEIFTGPDSYTTEYSQDSSNVIVLPTSGANCKVTQAGVYYVSVHITFNSLTADSTFRIRIWAGAAYDTETYIVGRNEQFVKDTGKYVVLSCSGIVVLSANSHIGAKAYSDKLASVVGFASGKNNGITIAKLW